MSSDSIKVFAPASVSNVGPGFDILGFALNEPGDEIILKKSSNDGIVISDISGDDGKLPFDPVKNTASVAIRSLLDKYQNNSGLDLVINKKMGLGSGLGSSAASAVGAVFAANELLDLQLGKDQLLEHALDGEYVASKAIHGDNVAPALYGGIILIRGYDPIDIIRIDSPDSLYCTIIYPNIEIKTSEARALLPKEVSLKKMVSQTGNVASLIYGLTTSNFDLISRSLNDQVVEPVRAQLIKGYDEIRNSVLEAGGLGCNISGSGPSLFSLTDSLDKANYVAEVSQKTVNDLGLECTTYVSKINEDGPRILD